MNRQITITGTGSVKVSPDTMVVTFVLSSHRLDYAELIKRSDEKLAQMQDLVLRLGFNKADLKTASFKIEPAYKRKKDVFGSYEQVQSGYRYIQALKLEFDLDMLKLAEIMTEVSKLSVSPKIDIGFTVKDKNTVKEQVLTDATENALAQAEVLTKASGVKLGDLVSISYSWGKMRFISESSYDFDDVYLGEASVNGSFEEMTPDEITVSDDATFVWEIV